MSCYVIQLPNSLSHPGPLHFNKNNHYFNIVYIYIYDIETGDTLYQRHLLNLSLIRRLKPDTIAIHFNSTEHSVNGYEIVALKKICGDNSYRETIEKLWMNKLRTFKPH